MAGLVKVYREYETDPTTGETKVVSETKLVFNAMTFVIYKNYFGTDLMADRNKLYFEQASNLHAVRPEIVKQIQETQTIDWEKVTPEDIEALSKLDTFGSQQFIVQLIVAMMATARYPQKCDVNDLIMEMPESMLYDADFVQNELPELMTHGLQTATQKKTVLR